MIVVWKEEVLVLARRSRRAEHTEVPTLLHMYMCITQGRAGGSLESTQPSALTGIWSHRGHGYVPGCRSGYL